MRSLAAALLALTLVACNDDTSPAGGDMGMDGDGGSVAEQLPDNYCGDVASCLIDECTDLWLAVDTAHLSQCRTDELVECNDAANAFIACSDGCLATTCSDGDTKCEDQAEEAASWGTGIWERCSLGLYSEAECDESLSWCDDVQDPTPSA